MSLFVETYIKVGGKMVKMRVRLATYSTGPETKVLSPVQLILEQHRFELCGSTYMGFFSTKYVLEYYTSSSR